MTSMMRTEVDGGGILYTLGEAHALPQQRDALQEDTGASCRGLRQKMSGTSPLPELDASPWRECKIDNCSFERASASFYHRRMLLCPVELPCFQSFYEFLRSSAA